MAFRKFFPLIRNSLYLRPRCFSRIFKVSELFLFYGTDKLNYVNGFLSLCIRSRRVMPSHFIHSTYFNNFQEKALPCIFHMHIGTKHFSPPSEPCNKGRYDLSQPAHIMQILASCILILFCLPAVDTSKFLIF